jgi:hypothetical protein
MTTEQEAIDQHDPTGAQMRALFARIERLSTANAALAQQVINGSDRLQESALQIAADAWDEGAHAALKSEGYAVTDNAAVLKTNRYRAIIREKETRA